MDALTFHAATPDDAVELRRLILALAEYEKLAHEVTGTDDDVRRMLSGPRPYLEAVLARRGAECVGFAAYYFTCSTFEARPVLFLEDLFVVPAHRAHGTGKALVAHLAGLALERGCMGMQWEVLDWNAPAIGFYASLGAKPRAGWTVYRLPRDAMARLSGSA